MKLQKTPWGLIGSIVADSILFIELGIDLYTGRMTGKELIELLAFCLILAVIIYYVIVRRKRKNRK